MRSLCVIHYWVLAPQGHVVSIWRLKERSGTFHLVQYTNFCISSFLCCNTTSCWRWLKGERAYLGSQSEVTVHSGGEVLTAGAWSSWSHCTHIPETETNAAVQFRILSREWCCPQWGVLPTSVKIIMIILPGQAGSEAQFPRDSRVCCH